MDAIDRIRHFNRTQTRMLGLLSRDYLASGLSLTEVRLLYNLGEGETTARALAGALDLDEGYVSRALARFRERGWVDRRADTGDARRFPLSLTEEGAAKLAEMQRKSRASIADRLGHLDGVGIARLADLLDRARTLLEGAPPRAELRPLAPGDAGWIVSRHGALYARDEGFDLTFEALVAEIVATFLRDHNAEAERAWIAWQGDRRVGSIFCVREGTPGVAKLRLFFLEPDARGLGLGRNLLHACRDFTRGAGYRTLRLWTHAEHRAACALYAAEGFRMVSSEPVHSFGRDVTEQVWDLAL